MALQNAVNLINTIGGNADMRKQLYSCQTASELTNWLVSNGFEFSESEFEDAVRYLHVKCQTEDDAMELLEKANWYRYLVSATTQKQ